MKTRLAAGLSLLLLGATIGHAPAHTPSDPEAVGNIARLSGAANLIFRGKVTRVRYRLAPAGRKGAGAVPYAYVTFSIGTVLQGSSPGRSITLRFIGGPDGQGGILEAEGVPHFQVGDEDILFVAGNGAEGCPLVMCEFGRFRVLNNLVHEAHGVPVVSVEAGRIRTEGEVPSALRTFSYPAPGFEEVMKVPEFAAAVRRSGMTMAEARAWYEAQSAETVEMRATEMATEAAPETKAAAAPALTVEPFLSAVRSEAARAAGRNFAPVRSIDSDAPMPAHAPVTSAPPPLPEGSEAAQNFAPGRTIRKN